MKYIYSFNHRSKNYNEHIHFDNFSAAVKAATTMDSRTANQINRKILNEKEEVVCAISDFVISNNVKSNHS